jgi:uncharacterized protein YndB with AHSA1/START domain
MTEFGRFLEVDGRPAVQFVRSYPHPIDRVWSAVTEPAQLRRWFPSSVEIDPRPGGTVKFSSDPHVEDSVGTVLAFDPPHHLAFSWGSDELRIDLEPTGPEACQLTLTNLLSERNTAARNASGWAVCLAELDKALAGVSSDGPHSGSALPFQPLYDAHLAAGLPSGAEIPTADGDG